MAESIIEMSTHTSSTFPVYIIYSRWSLEKIEKFLVSHGEVGFLRVVYDSHNRETERTIGIISLETYQKLCDLKYNIREYGKGLVIQLFTLKPSHYPGEGRTKTLFVPVPNILANNDQLVLDTINDKLKHLAEWGIIPDNSWSLNLPLESREKGGVKGGCFISFKAEVSLDNITVVRILLTDTYWPTSLEDPNKDRSIFQCFWARARNDKSRKSKKNKSTSVPGTAPENVQRTVPHNNDSRRTRRNSNKGNKGDKGSRGPKISKKSVHKIPLDSVPQPMPIELVPYFPRVASTPENNFENITEISLELGTSLLSKNFGSSIQEISPANQDKLDSCERTRSRDRGMPIADMPVVSDISNRITSPTN